MTGSQPIPAYVAFGANLGDRARTIGLALDQLRARPQIEVRKVSSLLENPAVGGPPDSPPFLNGVAEVSTTLSPREMLQALLEIEHRLGRERHRKWDPRTIDLDLLLGKRSGRRLTLDALSRIKRRSRPRRLFPRGVRAEPS